MADLNIKPNALFTADNLYVLNGMNSECIDLIYLDPPFNSKRIYKAPVGSRAAGAAFDDMWKMDDVDRAYLLRLAERFPHLYRYIESIEFFHSESMMAYIAYMAQRLFEMHRVLKPTGSIYLHCDQTAGHYLKIVMDFIFDRGNFLNEIIWCYSTSGRASAGKRRTWARKHDVILSYAKRIDLLKADCTLPCSDEYIESHYRHTDKQGRKCRIRVDAGKGSVYTTDRTGESIYCPGSIYLRQFGQHI